MCMDGWLVNGGMEKFTNEINNKMLYFTWLHQLNYDLFFY